MVCMPEFCAPALGNKSNVMTIDAIIPDNANGVLYKLGGNSGALTCFVENGILCYEYNLCIIQRTKIRAREKLPTGRVKIENRDALCRVASRRSTAGNDASRRKRRRGRHRACQRAVGFHR